MFILKKLFIEIKIILSITYLTLVEKHMRLNNRHKKTAHHGLFFYVCGKSQRDTLTFSTKN
ncbi:MAG TPA: hypothetical protein DF294_04080 [Psychrobacter sp.]|nr:hypothetical protein [Psychrobacter sp.]